MVTSQPPGGKFGPAPLTQALRPEVGLSEDEITTARRLRRDGESEQDIAEQLGVAVEVVQLALASMRTPTVRPTRRTINVGMNAYHEIIQQKNDGEALWQTMDRILTELQRLRDFSAKVRNDPST